MTDDREQLYWRLHDALPPGWSLTPASYHSEEGRWYVTAVDLRPRRRGAKHDSIEGLGEDELAAVSDLVAKLGDKSGIRHDS